MADDSDIDIKHSARLSDEQRMLIEEKVRRAKEQNTSAEHPTVAQSAAVHEDIEVGAYPASRSASAPTVTDVLPDFVPIDDRQREALRKQVEDRLKSKHHHQELRKRLLSMAGKEAIIDDHNPYNDLLMDRGQTWNSLEVNIISGPDMNTECSVAKLWQHSPTFYSIAAGYALDAAGTWHKHAWLIALHKVQEVKLKYAVYYGVQLSDKESEVFVSSALSK